MLRLLVLVRRSTLALLRVIILSISLSVSVANRLLMTRRVVVRLRSRISPRRSEYRVHLETIRSQKVEEQTTVCAKCVANVYKKCCAASERVLGHCG